MNKELSEETQLLHQFSEQAYLAYSMYVILDRALPHITDGLKPVQRRIIYAMSELGLKSTAKFKKSARTIGDVLGKFHPHGDSACYEAMVLMAQDFSYRYPLIDGQGNWGSVDDPRSFAAMRYTEARLKPYAESLLGELGQKTVDWIPNFDGTLKEPATLPSRLPNILLNGASGIAVGMSTDIPPHNLSEVVQACIHLLKFPESTVAELCDYVRGPDYPTGAEIITAKEDMVTLYEYGVGSIRLRACYQKIDHEIVITALPHQTSGSKVLSQIAGQMQEKKLPMVVDLRDESDHEHPVRLVIVPRSNRVNTESLMLHLFASTDLERSYRVNFNVIGLDGRPQVKNLKLLLNQWLNYRRATVKKRLQYRLDCVVNRLELLLGFLMAYANLDTVIDIIRSEDDPKTVLMTVLQLSDRQAEAILELKLKNLAKMASEKIEEERALLCTEKEELERVMQVPGALDALISAELTSDAKQHGDVRRSMIVSRAPAQLMPETQYLPNESITIVMSQQGWVRVIKKHEVDLTRLQYKSGDGFRMSCCGKNDQWVVFLDSTGRSYSVMAYHLWAAREEWEPLTKYFNLPTNAYLEAILMGELSRYVFLASDGGYGFMATLQSLITKNKAGKLSIHITDGATRLLMPQYVDSIDDSWLSVINEEGRLLFFPLNELPVLPRGRGNKMIHTGPQRTQNSALKTRVNFLAIMKETESLVVYAGKRHVTLKWETLLGYQGLRGSKGKYLPKGFRCVERLEVVD